MLQQYNLFFFINIEIMEISKKCNTSPYNHMKRMIIQDFFPCRFM